MYHSITALGILRALTFGALFGVPLGGGQRLPRLPAVACPCGSVPPAVYLKGWVPDTKGKEQHQPTPPPQRPGHPKAPRPRHLTSPEQGSPWNGARVPCRGIALPRYLSTWP